MSGAAHDATRIEAFSDAVFGFAVTLLVVSLEVPKTYEELLQVMKGLPVFAVTFAILLMIWQEHHSLFRRFPSADGVTIWLNGALLFLVVSYIYPLKFLFSGMAGGGAPSVRAEDVVSLMLIYGTGFAAIFVIFALLYWRAARRAADPAEKHGARLLIGHSLVYVAVAGISMALARFGGPRYGAFAGLSYCLLGPGQAFYHALAAKHWKAREPATPPRSPGSASH